MPQSYPKLRHWTSMPPSDAVQSPLHNNQALSFIGTTLIISTTMLLLVLQVPEVSSAGWQMPNRPSLPQRISDLPRIGSMTSYSSGSPFPLPQDPLPSPIHSLIYILSVLNWAGHGK